MVILQNTKPKVTKPKIPKVKKISNKILVFVKSQVQFWTATNKKL